MWVEKITFFIFPLFLHWEIYLQEEEDEFIFSPLFFPFFEMYGWEEEDPLILNLFQHCEMSHLQQESNL